MFEIFIRCMDRALILTFKIKGTYNIVRKCIGVVKCRSQIGKNERPFPGVLILCNKHIVPPAKAAEWRVA